MEKQKAQDKQVAIDAEAKLEAEKQEATEPVAQPSIEELLKVVEGNKQEIERKETQIKTLQGSLKAAQQRGAPKEDIDALHKKIDDMQDWTASALDDVVKRVSGEEIDEKPSRKSYRQTLDERRKEPKSEEKADPDVQKFIGYLHSQGLEYDDPLVQEAVADDRMPQEALKYLKGKSEEKNQTVIDERAGEIAKNMLEQKLKELGLTAPGAGEPSGPSTAWRDSSPEEKILQGVSKKK